MPAKKSGGKRPGSGRKYTGRNAVSKTVSMPATVWADIDADRGGECRGKYIMRKMGVEP